MSLVPCSELVCKDCALFRTVGNHAQADERKNKKILKKNTVGNRAQADGALEEMSRGGGGRGGGRRAPC